MPYGDSAIMNYRSRCKEEEAMSANAMPIDVEQRRFPYCIVWTPLPLMTWFFPFIGHLGIGTSTGVIRDFAGPYFVSEDNMAFGKPTKYWQLTPRKANDGQSGWDSAIQDAANVYSGRMHIICYDNCHSFVAHALNEMKYDNSNNWNMFWLAIYMVLYSKYVSFAAFVKTFLPFVLVILVFILAIMLTKSKI